MDEFISRIKIPTKIGFGGADEHIEELNICNEKENDNYISESLHKKYREILNSDEKNGKIPLYKNPHKYSFSEYNKINLKYSYFNFNF